MDRAADCAARSTDPSAHLWRVERHKHYGGIPVRLTGAVLPYDDAFDDFTVSTSVARSWISCPTSTSPIGPQRFRLLTCDLGPLISVCPAFRFLVRTSCPRSTSS